MLVLPWAWLCPVVLVVLAACQDASLIHDGGADGKSEKGGKKGTTATDVGTGGINHAALDKLANSLRVVVSCRWVLVDQEFLCAGSAEDSAAVKSQAFGLALVDTKQERLPEKYYKLEAQLGEEFIFTVKITSPLPPTSRLAIFARTGDGGYWYNDFPLESPPREGGLWDTQKRQVLELRPQPDPCAAAAEGGPLLCPGSAASQSSSAAGPKALSCTSLRQVTFDPMTAPTLHWQPAPNDQPEGITYQIALGTEPGGRNVKEWTDVGQSTSLGLTGLSLVAAGPYYASVRALDRLGQAYPAASCPEFFFEGLTTPAAMILHYDAALADQGQKAFAPGCTTSSLAWHDLSASSRTGTLSGFLPPCDTNGWRGNGFLASTQAYALAFTREVTTFVDVPALGSYDDVTVTAWLRLESIPDSNQLGSIFHDTGTGAGMLHLAISPEARLSPSIVIGEQAESFPTPATLDARSWYHIAFTYSVSKRLANSYINGKLAKSNTPVSTPPLQIGPARLGAWQHLGGALNGQLANFIVYRRDLSPSEILQNCQAQAHRFYSDAVTVCI